MQNNNIKTHMVIYNPNQKPSFNGALFTGTETQCKEYCKNNKGKPGVYFSHIIKPI
jgi:hypothetical protein